MATRTHYFALPFHKSDDGPAATLGHLIECGSDAEAISRAEQMSTYPEYAGAIAFAMRRRDGATYGALELKATFGVFDTDLADILRSIEKRDSF